MCIHIYKKYLNPLRFSSKTGSSRQQPQKSNNGANYFHPSFHCLSLQSLLSVSVRARKSRLCVTLLLSNKSLRKRGQGKCMEEGNVNAVNGEIIMSLESKQSKVPLSDVSRPGNRNSVQMRIFPFCNRTYGKFSSERWYYTVATDTYVSAELLANYSVKIRLDFNQI